jgi:phage shock protein E
LAFLAGCEKDTIMTPEQAWAAIEQPSLVIDVRTDEEVAAGTLKGSLHIPYEIIVARANEIGLAKDTPIVVYCRSGNRSGIAQAMLQADGYTAVVNGGAYADLDAFNPGAKVNAHWTP